MENKYGFLVNKRINNTISQDVVKQQSNEDEEATIKKLMEAAIRKLDKLRKLACTGIYLVELPNLNEYYSEEYDLSLLQYCYYRLIYDVAGKIKDELGKLSIDEYKNGKHKLVDDFFLLSLGYRVSKKSVISLCDSLIKDEFKDYRNGTFHNSNWNIEKVADTIRSKKGCTKELLKAAIDDYKNFIRKKDYKESIQGICYVYNPNILAVNFPYNLLSANKWFPDISALIYIVNIDAADESYRKVCRNLPFVWDVIGSLIHKTLPSICGEKGDYILKLLYNIPIRLKKENKEINELGAYFSNENGNSPYIELYVDKILESANGKDFKWLFTKVLIHELAHAALDINNCVCYGNVTEKVLYSEKFGKWREESMANAVALRVIRDYGDKSFYDYSEDFMLQQDPEYALGVKMVDWDYSDFCSVMDGKRNGVDEALKDEWLKYAQGENVMWEGLHEWNGILSAKTVYIYNNKYYIRNEQLVLDIILDFQNQHGSKSFQKSFQNAMPQKWDDNEFTNFLSTAVSQGIKVTKIENFKYIP